ncbi:MAG TPA: cupin domain-containing protein [Myxococcaceae bacterium]|jgi:mannose-6-phosphate isomerase-like protein (cupin superfamily)
MQSPGLSCIAWAESGTRPGIVRYELQADHSLKAEWNHPNNGLAVGGGEATRIEPGGTSLAGTYWITYVQPDGTRLPRLHLEISPSSSGYSVTWSQEQNGERKVAYKGVGVALQGGQVMAVAWDGAINGEARPGLRLTFDASEPITAGVKVARLAETLLAARTAPEPLDPGEAFQSPGQWFATTMATGPGGMLSVLYVPEVEDLQGVHSQDEVYFVAQGAAAFLWGQASPGASRKTVAAGDFLFVRRGIHHRFEELSDDFAVWVVFYGFLPKQDGKSAQEVEVVSLRSALDRLKAKPPAPPADDPSDAFFELVFEDGMALAGLYKPGNGEDLQLPHTQDEVYIVAQGRAVFVVGDRFSRDPRQQQRWEVSAGDYIYLARHKRHQFIHLSSDFATWALFYGETRDFPSGAPGPTHPRLRRLDRR